MCVLFLFLIFCSSHVCVFICTRCVRNKDNNNNSGGDCHDVVEKKVLYHTEKRIVVM